MSPGTGSLAHLHCCSLEEYKELSPLRRVKDLFPLEPTHRLLAELARGRHSLLANT